MTDHAKLSPSAADRWMGCPGSVWLSDGMPSKSSEFAEEGTRAHSLAEAILTGGKGSGPVEMVEHVMVYVDHVQALVEGDDE